MSRARGVIVGGAFGDRTGSRRPIRGAASWPLIALSQCLSRSTWGAEEPIPTLNPPRPPLPPTFWEQHGTSIEGAAIIILAGILVWLRVRKKAAPAQILAPEAQAKRALDGLRGRLEDPATALEASRALRRYLIAVFELPATEMTTAELRAELKSRPQVRPELASAIAEFLRRCDELKFAPARDANRWGVLDAAVELVDRIHLEQTREASTPGPGSTGPGASIHAT